jgi:signal transduction histidine kinase
LNSKNRHIIAILLIISSIALLLFFQAFWLRKVYFEQTELIRKEADNIFQKTMTALQDSLIQSTIVPLQNQKEAKIKITREFDTLKNTDFRSLNKIKRLDWKLNKKGSPPNLHFRTSDQVLVIGDSSSNTTTFSSPIKADTLKSAQIQVFVGASPNHDSLGKIAGNIVSQVIRTPNVKNYVITLKHESLQLKGVTQAYQRALNKASLPIQFQVFEIKNPQKKPVFSGLITTEFHCIPFFSDLSFIAQLSDYQWFILKKISPQIIFSLILLSITCLAFYWIYRSMRQQQILTDLKNDFIRNVTHELKTPITTVSVAIEALQNFNVLENPPLTQEYLEISKSEINRLSLLVDKILKTAVFEQKGVDLKAESIDLKALIQQILNSLKLQFEKYKAVVDFEIEGQDFVIQGDMIHLTNVIYNLLDNALKYSPENPIIQIKLQESDNQMVIKIKDFGIGIEKEHQSKIFDKFFRVPTGDVHTIKGYGLGLSYVKSVILQHQGYISVESEKSKGSLFSINLPKKMIDMSSKASVMVKKSA